MFGLRICARMGRFCHFCTGFLGFCHLRGGSASFFYFKLCCFSGSLFFCYKKTVQCDYFMNFQTANPNPVTSIAYSGCRLTFYIQFVWLQGLFLVLSMSCK